MLFFMLGLWGATTSFAQVPEPDGVYAAGTRIEYPDAGVAYVLPASTVGMTSTDNPVGEMVVGLMPDAQRGDNALYVQIGNADFDALVRDMGHVVVFKGTALEPLGEPTVTDGAVYNDFSYTEDGKSYRAFMLVVMTGGDGAVMLLASAPPELIQGYREMVAQLARSIETGAGDGGGQAPPQAGSAGDRPYINQSGNGSAVIGGKCSYVSAGGMTVKVCD